MGNALGRDFGSQFYQSLAAAITDLTAGGTGDNTKVTGSTLDQAALSTRFSSVVFLIVYKAVLSAGKKLTVALEVQHSDDGSTWTTYETVSAAVENIDGGSGSTVGGVGKKSYDLRALKRYVRANITPNLDASGTDTARVGCVAILGSGDRGAIVDSATS